MSDALSARLAQEQARKVATEIAEPVARTIAVEVATDVAGRTAQTIARDTAGLAVAELPGIAATVAERIAAERVVAEVNDWLLANPPKEGKAGLSVQGDKGDAGDAGVPGLVWRGPWSRGTQYQPNDAVSFEGSSYVATRPTRAKPPTGWDLLAEKGDPGETMGPGVLTTRGFGRGGLASGLAVFDEGTALNGGAVLGGINFTGAGVTVTQEDATTGARAAVDIPGGGGPVTTNVYVQPTDPGVVGDGKLWVDTTTPGPPWHVQIRNATDDGWEDLLADYLATIGVVITAGGDGQGVTLKGSNGTTGDGGTVAFFGGQDATGAGNGSSLSAGGGSATSGGPVTLRGGSAATGVAGGDALLRGGDGNDGDDDGARFTAKGGSGAGAAGKAQVTTNGSTGPGPLVSDGTDVTYNLAAFVEPTTATPEQIALSLIAAGLMAAS